MSKLPYLWGREHRIKGKFVISMSMAFFSLCREHRIEGKFVISMPMDIFSGDIDIGQKEIWYFRCEERTFMLFLEQI